MKNTVGPFTCGSQAEVPQGDHAAVAGLLAVNNYIGNRIFEQRHYYVIRYSL